MNSPAWIFFDVGWTLVDETPAFLKRFEAGRDYAEPEVNAIIDANHLFGDYALLRRELVDRGLLQRDKAGRRYRRKIQTE
jgi:hypothetical protein